MTVKLEKANLGPLTDDTWRKVFSFLPIEDRLRCEHVCRNWRCVLSNWSDVRNVQISTNSITVANEQFSSTFNFQSLASERWQSFLVKVVSKCSKVSTLVVENRNLMPLIADILRSRQAIHTVTFGHDFFARDFFRRLPAFVSSLISSKNLRQLIVLSNQLLLPSVANVITPLHIQRIRSNCLQVVVLQNVLLDVNTLHCLAERYSTTCRELRIGGALCDSAKTTNYWKEIERFCFVKTLEIPSSIFVVNSQSLRSDIAKPLKNFVHLEKLCVAVATVQARDIQRFILDCLPECLEKLVLYHMLSSTHVQINVPKNRKLLVEQHGQAISYSLTANWMHKVTSLAYKTMWLPPYFPVGR
ncbi:hypothetical protein M3Y98_00611300 [Aphelenchoides besseyi]|nr:hypothetical protein M3Y98_00611300 [Aphelenchoides besseyi]